MNKNDILLELSEICKTVFNDADLQITNETAARDVANWDSLTNLILIDSIESRYSIKFSLDEILEAQNVGDLCEIVFKKQEKKGS